MRWNVERTEQVRFYLHIEGVQSVVLANGAGARVNSVSVVFRRRTGQEWGQPSIAVGHGFGWDMTTTCVPLGLRGGQIPEWLADLLREVRP